MLCEMCGKDSVDTKLIKVEGATLRLCSNCSKFGKEVTPPPPARTQAPKLAQPSVSRRQTAEERDIYSEMPPMELYSDWMHRVRSARESRGLTQEQFGTLLREKISVIHKLESGEIVPPDALVLKIERMLKVRLRAPVEAS